MSDSTAHYVVRVIVERVDRVTEVPGYGSREARFPVKLDNPRRTVTELANITVKANTVLALIDKAEAHLHLVEDIDATDSRAEVGKRA